MPNLNRSYSQSQPSVKKIFIDTRNLVLKEIACPILPDRTGIVIGSEGRLMNRDEYDRIITSYNSLPDENYKKAYTKLGRLFCDFKEDYVAAKMALDPQTARVFYTAGLPVEEGALKAVYDYVQNDGRQANIRILNVNGNVMREDFCTVANVSFKMGSNLQQAGRLGTIFREGSIQSISRYLGSTHNLPGDEAAQKAQAVLNSPLYQRFMQSPT